MFKVIRETPTGAAPTGEAYDNVVDAQRAVDWHNEFSEDVGLRERYAVAYPDEPV